MQFSRDVTASAPSFPDVATPHHLWRCWRARKGSRLLLLRYRCCWLRRAPTRGVARKLRINLASFASSIAALARDCLSRNGLDESHGHQRQSIRLVGKQTWRKALCRLGAICLPEIYVSRAASTQQHSESGLGDICILFSWHYWRR